MDAAPLADHGLLTLSAIDRMPPVMTMSPSFLFENIPSIIVNCSLKC
jgi:hypothetical protein